MILFLGVFLLFLLKILSHAAVLNVKVIVEKAEIMSAPAHGSQVITQVPSGIVLRSERKTGEWYAINLSADKKGLAVSGYIHQDNVEVALETKEVSQWEEEIREKPGARAASGIGIRTGYVMPSDEKYGRGLQYGGNICLGITKNIGFELSGLLFQSDVEGDPEALSKGKLSLIPIQLSIQFRLPLSDSFVFYLMGGGGYYYMYKFTIDEEITDAWESLGFDIEEQVENAIGYHFGGGIDLFLTRNIALNADFRYCLAKTTGSWSISDQISGTQATGDLENLSLNSIMFGGGLKLCF